MTRSEQTVEDGTVRLVRTIKAPAEKVYDAWLDPDMLVRWIGPGGPGATRVDTDCKHCAHTIWVETEDGEKRHFHWEVAEAEPPKLLILDFAFGGPIGSELTDYRSRLTLEFEEANGATEMTLVHTRIPEDMVKGVSNGWPTVTDRLVDYLEAPEASN